MSIVSKVTAYGTPGVIAVGAGAIWGQSLLQWVTQPSHMIAVGGVAATAAAARAMSKGKVKPEPQAPAVAPVQEPQALPQGQPTAAEAQAYLRGIRETLLARQAEPTAQPKRVIDLGHVER
jgi:hypothetical protein